MESSPVGKKRAADVVDIMDSPTPSKSLRSTKSPVAQKATVSSPQLELVQKSPLPVVKEEKPLLAVFAANAVASPTKKVREVHRQHFQLFNIVALFSLPPLLTV